MKHTSKSLLSIFLLIPVLYLWSCKSSTPVSEGVSIDFSGGEGAVIIFDSTKQVKFEWIYPVEKYSPANKQVRIELKVTSTHSLKDEDFKVFRDDLGSLESGKAGEVTLTPLSREKEYIYSTVVPLNTSVARNAIYVRVMGMDSPVRFIDIADHSDVSISWITPNPATLSPPLYIHSQEEKLMKVSWEIHSLSLPNKEDITLHINDRDLGLSNQAEIVTLRSNQYRLTDIIEIKDPGRVQTLSAEFGGIRSSKLKFKYVILGKPNLYVISIGPETDLDFTTHDATDFADVFRDQGGSGTQKIFNEVHVFPGVRLRRE